MKKYYKANEKNPQPLTWNQVGDIVKERLNRPEDKFCIFTDTGESWSIPELCEIFEVTL